ncbi:deoxyuridine 5'-triphosphate nucleotidohydrolase [Methylobacterium indicum]|uniref:putative bifunctional diguanylate cyclase/phosphodiesterase n=1 Tax=Methylobacterium indicum TaxID=1775910 RepID=UPI000734EF99|nr:EAL domain-containing protein [Methylobacterium indicum]KTS35390.1 deoxyuridine 5'-triphosphate nucleotidohydrolase [Methylobacterium indicum]KTS42069.1 deoxyuridine 5'-triphosphate nucleotidohydrolase [Methylobacterium indicum]KTS50080.1 deoxyuridine 5'-triphosphate nucleotidohydrolase [Methylobacterium indicum]
MLPTSDDPDLRASIRRDQLESVRRSIQPAMLVNALLGVASALVAFQAGSGRAGLAWFAVSSAVNLLRVGLCRAPCPGLAAGEAMTPGQALEGARSVDRHLQLATLAALLSGIVWSLVPLLCDGYTSPETLFYLIVTCGITAGAVTHGMAFAAIPASFITPPLLTAAGCLAWAGGFDRVCLALTVLLYLAALLRSAVETERNFRRTSRLKNEATALARSRQEAHAAASALAEEMRRRATHDVLTGLNNRAGFALAAEERIQRPGPAPCLMLLDLDGFKSVNDVYGHTTGDRVLIEVARRLRRSLPPEALAARFGGDEFAVLYDPGTALPPADLAAALIRTVVEPFEGLDAGRLGISAGLCHAHGPDLTQMLSCADTALHAAKAAGRNRFRIFDESLRGRLEMRRDSERDLSHALAEGGIVIWFQPIFGEGGRAVAGLEALVRWHHPVHGWIPPGEIVSAAARAGLTESLLRVILEQVCAALQALRAGGAHHVRVAMNVSPREMVQIPVDEIVLERLRALGLPPSMLEIEITEETALDIEAVQAKLLALSRAGIGVALDDFGIGYSSLASLRQLRAGRVKIDRSLVTGLAESDDKRGLVQAVLGLGRALDLEVVAEGVETAEDLAVLRSLGCPFVQGYHLGRPVPAEQALHQALACRPDAA